MAKGRQRKKKMGGWVGETHPHTRNPEMNAEMEMGQKDKDRDREIQRDRDQ